MNFEKFANLTDQDEIDEQLDRLLLKDPRALSDFLPWQKLSKLNDLQSPKKQQKASVKSSVNDPDIMVKVAPKSIKKSTKRRARTKARWQRRAYFSMAKYRKIGTV